MATDRAARGAVAAGIALLVAPLLAAAEPTPAITPATSPSASPSPAAEASAAPRKRAVQAYAFTPSSRVTYTVGHRMGKTVSRSNRILGTVTVAGTEIGTPFTLRVPIASFRGAPMRDVQALRALGGARHPDAVLVVERVELAWKTFVPGAVGGRLDFKGTAHGTLALRGVTRPVAIAASGWAMPVDASVNASFAISLKEYGIKAPRWLMSPVADRVEVEVEGIASRLVE